MVWIMSKYIYILQKSYIDLYRNYNYGHIPIAASNDYDTITDYVKNLINDILIHGDVYFNDYKPENLIVWHGYNYYTICGNDRKTLIIFKIQTVPNVNDIGDSKC